MKVSDYDKYMDGPEQLAFGCSPYVFTKIQLEIAQYYGITIALLSHCIHEVVILRYF